MKIRAGYQISYDCPQPTPMILQVSVHPSRQADLISWDGLKIDPVIPANTYHDTFGNFCHVIRAPAGRLTLSTDFLVQDSGELQCLHACLVHTQAACQLHRVQSGAHQVIRPMAALGLYRQGQRLEAGKSACSTGHI